MKIALITDTHWGIRGDAIAFHNYFKRSLDDFFFPILEEQKINHIIHLGDVVDRRKYVNFMTAHRLRKDFLDEVKRRNMLMDIIIGNHDTYYKNTNALNALYELVDGKYVNINIYAAPETVKFGDVPILYVPWICDENREETINAINTTEAQIVMGHLELTGFEMYRGHINDHGMDHNIFGRFDVVCSGHYHHKSDSNGIHYLGAFAEYTWSDYDDPRGFHVFDTDTRTLTFYRNPFSIFKKIWYDDVGKNIDQATELTTDTAGCIVKVIVKNKTNPYWFDMLIDRIEKTAPLDMQVVEDHLHLDLESDDDILDEAEDTVTIFKNYIGQLNLEGVRRDKLEKTIIGLYQEAISLE